MASGKTSVFSANDLLCISQKESHYLTLSSAVGLLTVKSNLKRQYSNELINQQSELEVKQQHELQLEKQGYQLSSKTKLGEGGFGVVYQVHSLKDKSAQFACKVMAIRKEKTSQRDYLCLLKTFTSEVQIMQSCSHENIVSLRQYFVDNHKEEEGPIYGYIIMDYAQLGSLYEKLKISGPFDETTARDLFGQTASALEHLHHQGIAHLDLTLANILLTRNGDHEVAKLTDFGLSFRAFSEQTGLILLSKPVGTLFYMSPELIECFILYYTGNRLAIRPYNGFCADLWALGVCLYMMLCKVNPFKSNPLEASGTLSFHSLQSYHFATLQTKEEEGGETQSGPKKNLSTTWKEERIRLAKSILAKQASEEQWKIPEAIKQNTSEFCLQMIRGLLTSDPQMRFDIGQVQSHYWLV